MEGSVLNFLKAEWKVFFFGETLTSNSILYGVNSRFIFSMDPSAMILLYMEVMRRSTHQELLFVRSVLILKYQTLYVSNCLLLTLKGNDWKCTSSYIVGLGQYVKLSCIWLDVQWWMKGYMTWPQTECCQILVYRGRRKKILVLY